MRAICIHRALVLWKKWQGVWGNKEQLLRKKQHVKGSNWEITTLDSGYPPKCTWVYSTLSLNDKEAYKQGKVHKRMEGFAHNNRIHHNFLRYKIKL